jgi:hypothetical protein
MKGKSNWVSFSVVANFLLVLSCLVPAKLTAQLSGERIAESRTRGAIGPGNTIVQSQFGGQIFGFDIDQNGTEGVLSEAQLLPNGKVLAAVESFDQATGKILKVIKKSETEDDFLTLGVVGSSVGLVEHEHVQGLYVAKRIYEELSPLDSNKFTGTWTPPLTKDDIIISVSRNQYSPAQGEATNAVLAFENSGNFNSFVFGSNIAANTSQPLITLTDTVFSIGDSPVMAYDSTTNQAVVAASTGEVGGPPPVFALVDLTVGTVVEFNGLPGAPPYRAGFINGIAVDSADGIACTTTELDFSVEFYNLKKKTGVAVTLPGATSQFQSGSDVEFDPVNKLFLVAQSVSSTGSGSSIQVYNTKGKLVESLNGFNFSNASNVVSTHIALNTNNRSGYVDGPNSEVTEIQSFTY